mmetsp:Transcript_21845/g.49769  ORF Transcript_21845/g.49769 Transcript_21845/m.49769 type:complete len:282 (+) Transcript_21845:4352-5197(+)
MAVIASLRLSLFVELTPSYFVSCSWSFLTSKASIPHSSGITCRKAMAMSWRKGIALSSHASVIVKKVCKHLTTFAPTSTSIPDASNNGITVSFSILIASRLISCPPVCSSCMIRASTLMQVSRKFSLGAGHNLPINRMSTDLLSSDALAICITSVENSATSLDSSISLVLLRCEVPAASRKIDCPVSIQSFITLLARSNARTTHAFMLLGCMVASRISCTTSSKWECFESRETCTFPSIALYFRVFSSSSNFSFLHCLCFISLSSFSSILLRAPSFWKSPK